MNANVGYFSFIATKLHLVIYRLVSISYGRSKKLFLAIPVHMSAPASIRYMVIDDNPVDALILKEYAGAYPLLQEAGLYHSSDKGLQALETIRPDLVFLDIEMPGLTGLDILKQLRTQIPMAVFITSHAEFALDGFELSALDYILKPLSAERFALTAARIFEFHEMKQKATAYEVLFDKESLVIKEGRTQIKIPQHDIIFMEAMQDYTKVVTGKRNYLMLTTLGGLLEQLMPEKFLRVHRSYAVAIGKIKELGAGKLLCDEFIIPIGKTYRSQLANLNLPL